MKLIDVLREECVVAGAQFQNKAEVLQYVAQLAKKSPILKNIDEQEILTGLQERESLGSTGFGKGIAIPHCRLKSVTDFVVGIITVPSGVDFDALDSDKVRLIIFIIAPEAESNKHIKLLSTISQTLSIPGVTEELLTAGTDEVIRESFLRHTLADIDTRKQIPKVNLNVFVQNDNVFKDILEKLEGIETSSIVVLNAEQTGAYLKKIPLFADLWRDKPQEFCTIIVTVLAKKLVNETIRRIESVTGNLNECTGVMITVQDILYTAGSL